MNNASTSNAGHKIVARKTQQEANKIETSTRRKKKIMA